VYVRDTSPIAACRLKTKSISPVKKSRSSRGVRHETILIIEEDDDLRRLLSLALRLGGFTTREARDGLEAMAILEQLVTLDAVVLDVVLPDIDGRSIRQEIAAHAGSVPVILITESQEPFLDLDPSCIVRKPVVPDDIVMAVVKCLRASV
jgi:two-component system, cell cycle sensor histidine kinase and response regulator CckA